MPGYRLPLLLPIIVPVVLPQGYSAGGQAQQKGDGCEPVGQFGPSRGIAS